METWQAIAVGIIPSIGVGLIFWFAVRAVIRADRNERAALASEDEAARARQAAVTSDDAPVAAGDDAPVAAGDDAPAARSAADKD